jgi:Uma2 family endonuclease
VRIPAVDVESLFIDGYPDLAIEVLSPADSMSDVLRKIGDYLEAGAKQVWIIDPKNESAEVYSSGDRVTRLTDDQFLSGGDVLAGFALNIKALFE